MAAANGIDVDTAMLKLHEAQREADTLDDLPPDADAVELARAYADVVFRVLDREKLIVSAIEALAVEVKGARRDIYALKREIAEQRADRAKDRTESAKRHSELIALLAQLAPGYR